MEQQFSGVLVQRDETNLVNHNKLYLFQRTQVIVQGSLGVLFQQYVCQLSRSKETDTPPLLAGFQSNSRSQMGLSRPNAPHKNQVLFWGKELEVGHVFLWQAARKFNGGVPHKIIQCLHHPETSRLYHAVTYANDYRDLSVLKRLADKHGIAILLIHHLRKEKAEDVFHRISGTTAISGAVDSSFTLVEEKRGNGRARLTCVGRDIEYRELELRRGEENVWELVSDSREEPVLCEDRIVVLLSAFMSTRTIFIGTPTELSEKIDPDKTEGVTPKKISRLILQSVEALRKNGIAAVVRRSNGKRVIELNRADSVDLEDAGEIVPIDPAAVDQLFGEGAAGAGETDSSLRGGQASRPAIRHAQFRGAAPYPAPKGEKEEQCRE